ncbi:MAG: hypothetical protein M1819_005217 [Sarea resinae]|nr:MAG: hypothetical protein M1819_005217 [Sarea resinae]
MLTILEERGFVNSIAGERDALDQLLTNKRIGAYVGIDPTAPSLHVGHMLPFMALFWMYINGYHTVSLVSMLVHSYGKEIAEFHQLGGATAKVGDPTGRTTSRTLQPAAVQKANMVSMHYQLKKLWRNVEDYARKYGYVYEWAWHRELVNNNAWMGKLTMLEFLRLLGTGVRLGTMLGRDTVRNKMEKGDGMSFAEFSYPLMQAWDWWYMYQTKGVQIQIGGSDQFGNIVAGMDAIKYISKNHHNPDIRQEKEDERMLPYGFTVPLLTTSSGEKFGKSAGNAVWLDKDMTSIFDLYQFFLRSSDADVGRYLKVLTFMPLPKIEQIMTTHMEDPAKRVAQHALARDFVELVHGEEAAKAAESQHRMIFRSSSAPVTPQAVTPGPTASPVGDINPSLNRRAPQTTPNNAPTANLILPKSLIENQSVARVLYSAGLVSSRSEGHRLAQNQGAYLGSRSEGGGAMGDSLSFTPVKLRDPKKTQDYVMEGGLLILRVGKWKVKIVQVVSDEEFERLGLDAPGWKEDEKRAAREAEAAAKEEKVTKKKA